MPNFSVSSKKWWKSWDTRSVSQGTEITIVTEYISWNDPVIFVFFAHKKYHCSFIDVIWSILMMSLIHFLTLNVEVVLLYMKGQKALGLKKIKTFLNLCSEDERRSYGL